MNIKEFELYYKFCIFQPIKSLFKNEYVGENRSGEAESDRFGRTAATVADVKQGDVNSPSSA
ncbi:hypothetical protein DERF_003598 [Dermatophagoides farinae]|uniref:Uncharacterized protein n=1 Tax=Dermatophagoides farinae TaxID=6954 RepID=A0A922IFP3_DERFA|nr:hypothetical protein DERF_003598 [Dermatophagoides farinae]